MANPGDHYIYTMYPVLIYFCPRTGHSYVMRVDYFSGLHPTGSNSFIALIRDGWWIHDMISGIGHFFCLWSVDRTLYIKPILCHILPPWGGELLPVQGSAYLVCSAHLVCSTYLLWEKCSSPPLTHTTYIHRIVICLLPHDRRPGKNKADVEARKTA